MPYLASIGRHACRIHVGDTAATCFSARQGDVFHRRWPSDPTDVVAAVAFHAAPFDTLLCGTPERGCLAVYLTLQAEGRLP